MINIIDKVNKYYTFTGAELSGMVVSVLVLSFLISFRDWGADKFNLAAGLFNWFNAALIVALVLMIFNFVQKVAGLSLGYKVEYKMWTTGLFIGLILTFVSRGKIWVLLPGGIMLHHIAGHRLGHYRYNLNYFQHGMVAVAGTISLITLAAIFKVVNVFIGSDLLQKLILFCLILAIYDILPIPPLSGNRLFFGSRMVYAFMFSTIIAASILLMVSKNILMAILGSIIIGIICWLLYYIFFESKVWKGPWPKN